MRRLIKSFGWAISGIRTVWHEELNFRIEVGVATVVVFLGIYFSLSVLEWGVIIVCIATILASEILNTAIEDLCNKIEPNTDPVIGKIKDMMGGFVLTICFGAVVVGLMIFSQYLL